MVSTELSPVLEDRTFPPINDSEIREESPAIDDWSIVRHDRLHALVIGSHAAAGAVLSRVFPQVRWSHALWSPADGPDHRYGQIALVSDPQDLTDAQQEQLLSWMARHPSIQVISVASRPLYPDGRSRIVSRDALLPAEHVLLRPLGHPHSITSMCARCASSASARAMYIVREIRDRVGRPVG